MKKLILFLVLFVAFSLHVLAQTASEEIQQLKDHLGVSDQAKITPANSSGLTSLTWPLKAYIATGLDMKVHDNFARWIDKWNSSDDAKKIRANKRSFRNIPSRCCYSAIYT